VTVVCNTMVRACVEIAMLSVLSMATVQAQPVLEQSDAASIQVPQDILLEQLGGASFYVSIFHVYDAELWGPKTGFSWDDPFRLKLTYARKISADQLVNTSLTEMVRVSGGKAQDFEALRRPLAECFRDVKKGDVIEGVSESRNAATFYFNGEQTCRLTLPMASYQFFSIWLGERSRSPKQTWRLLGKNNR